MPYYAEIRAGRVSAVTESSGPLVGAVFVPLESLANLAGKLYDPQTGEFSDPPDAPLPRRVTRLAFLTRFTDAEAIQIDLASIGTTVEAATVRRYLNKVNAATFIDLDDDDTRAGVQALETVGLIATGRAVQILDAEIQPGERP